jgi:hypothetical protein
MPSPAVRMTRLAKAINDKFDLLTASMWKVGKVTAIVGATVTVTVDSGSVTLPKLASYSPTVGDVVQIAWPKNRPFVLGRIG